MALLGLGLIAGPGAASAQQFKIGDVTIRPVGRLFIDHALYDWDEVELKSGGRPTSLRLGAGGQVGDKISFLLQFELREWFKHRGQGKQLRYAFVTYHPTPEWRIDLGQLDQPFALEGMATSKNMTFMEWGLPIVIAPYYHAGLVVTRRLKQGSISAGYFGKTLGQEFDDAGRGGSVRAIHSPISSDGLTFHLGGSVGSRNPKDDVARFLNTPESAITSVRLVDTGPIRDVRAIKSLGLETVVLRGPLSLQGEYIETHVTRRSAKDVAVNGGYAFVSYLVTGEQRPFDPVRGAFGTIKPRSKGGAVELAARVSWLDLKDGPIDGGRETNFTLGANWYINQHVRLMLNYVAAQTRRAGVSDDPSVIQARVHFEL